MNFLESALREEARKLVACLRGKGVLKLNIRLVR